MVLVAKYKYSREIWISEINLLNEGLVGVTVLSSFSQIGLS
jgi:hypothetical protein